jgi:aminoglycoside/choline kinase family phosphotransferase
MIKDELLSLLFRDFTGHSPESLTVLPKSGSDRIYCRMVKEDFSVLGVWNPSRKENDAFTGFAARFNEIGLRVPRVFKYLPEEMVYLTEDLGDLDLYTWVQERRNDGEKGRGSEGVIGRRGTQVTKLRGAEEGEVKIEEMYRSVLKELTRFQFEADKIIDYELAYPRKKFDRNSVMWDLNYFKYMFLKLSGTGFNEQLLEEDFKKMATTIEKVKASGFLYRDFQSRNVMVKGGMPWFIDFQGGRKGAPYYDVASLLLDPYVELDSNLHKRLLDYYFEITTSLIKVDLNTFYREYLVFGTVRLLQALGAYGFRGLYERKPNFTESIPPAVRQLHRIFENDEITAFFPELSRIVAALYKKYEQSGADSGKKTTVIIESFSFIKGIPETFVTEGGFMFDCRHLSDPYYTEELKSLTGRDKKVIDFFDDKKDIQDMVDNALRLINGSLESSVGGKMETLRVCFGCYSGHHRSVYCAEKMASSLKRNKLLEVLVFHHEIR